MAKEKTRSFEEQLLRLEEIIDALDNSEIPLGEQLKQYEEGIGLVRNLRDFLNKAEMKVIDITAQDKQEK